MTSRELIARIGNDYRLNVHATPGAKREQVGGQFDGALKVSVTSAADKGKANEAITKLLAAELGVKAWQITLQTGATNRRKVFLISDADEGLVALVATLARS